jgi:hypothetical protein
MKVRFNKIFYWLVRGAIWNFAKSNPIMMVEKTKNSKQSWRPQYINCSKLTRLDWHVKVHNSTCKKNERCCLYTLGKYKILILYFDLNLD